MTTSTEKLATKTKKLVDCRVEIDLYISPWRVYTPEQKATELEEAAEKFRDFIRDHRHQDVTGVRVVRDVIDACSNCGDQWETFTVTAEDCENFHYVAGEERCASCGTLVKAAPVAIKKES